MENILALRINVPEEARVIFAKFNFVIIYNIFFTINYIIICTEIDEILYIQMTFLT